MNKYYDEAVTIITSVLIPADKHHNIFAKRIPSPPIYEPSLKPDYDLAGHARVVTT